MQNDPTQTYDQAQSVKPPAAVTGPDGRTTPASFLFLPGSSRNCGPPRARVSPGTRRITRGRPSNC